MEQSEINPIIDINYIKNEAECIYFDLKSSQIKPKDLAPHFSAFANAEGGVIVVGVSDKTRKIEGINHLDHKKLNDFIAAPHEYCKPTPNHKIEYLDVINDKGEKDKIILYHIMAETERIIRTSNDSTYLRIGDKSKELKGDDLLNLEYSKNTRMYEDEINYNASIEDLDDDLLNQYKDKISANHLTTYQVLKARGFIMKKDNKEYFTNAAVLLFAKNIMQFYPNCRIRFLRYDGEYMQVGKEINIIKDINIEYPLLKIIEEAKKVISSQLREFTMLSESGKFITVPEYPEFAWLEGITNAVTHRLYSLQGDYIKISMFDDRLEISSPGKLPNIVTLENIKETRYSRNPKIARVLTEFGWVRELNEGVKRIYKDMEMYFLDEPEYSMPYNNVLLILKNNIVMRRLRKKTWLENVFNENLWDSLDDNERRILYFISNRGKATRKSIESYMGLSSTTINSNIRKLINKGLVERIGPKNSPKQYIKLKILD